MKNFDYMDDSEESSRGLIEEGVSLNYGPLSLCKVKRLVGSQFQVDCMYHRITYTKLFNDFSTAFNKFLDLKQALINTGYKERVYASRRPSIPNKK